MKILEIGLGAIVIGIILFVVGGIINLITSESSAFDYISKSWNYVIAGWVMGFAQLLVFAGIGFILYDVATKKGADPLSKFQESKSKKDDSEIEYTEMDSVMVCPHCIRKFKFPKVMEGSVGKCPRCDDELELKDVGS